MSSSDKLKITIISGQELLPCDKGNTSDPYVKIFQEKTLLLKTTVKNQTLNPVWNEEFIIETANTRKPYLLQVFDKDNLSFDDFMGQVEIRPDGGQLEKSMELTLRLEPGNDKKLIKKTKKNEEALGTIKVNFQMFYEGPFSKENEIMQHHNSLENSISHKEVSESHKGLEETCSEILNYDEHRKSIKTKNIEIMNSDEHRKSIKSNKELTNVESSVEEANLFQSLGSHESSFESETSVYFDGVKDQMFEDPTQDPACDYGNKAGSQANTEAVIKHNCDIVDTIKTLLLTIELISGEDLVACDKGNVSDPYVKIYQQKNVLFKTSCKVKTLNPVWNEGFSVEIQDTTKPLLFQVFDDDKFSCDDFMGEAELDLATMKLDEPTDVTLQLDSKNDENLIKKMEKNKQSLGNIKITLKLSVVDKVPLEQTKKPKISLLKSMAKKLSRKSVEEHDAIVHVVLVQAHSLALMAEGTDCDPYCKLSLGNQKFTSKTIRDNINPKWREAFNFHWYKDSDDFLHIETRHNDDKMGIKTEFLGSLALNLNNFTPEVSHNIWRPLLGEKGVDVGDLHLIVTVTCYTKHDSPSMLANWKPEQPTQLSDKYQLRNTFACVPDVGHLTIKVLRAEGLASTDYNGLADPFVVLELKNARVRTRPIPESLNPQWDQVFHFDIKDINNYLEITIYDENDNTKEDFLGRVIIPLLKINNGERRWFNLKDKRLWKQANGKNPRILIETDIHWNPIRAAYRTTQDAEMKYLKNDNAKFSLKALAYNCYRVKNELLKITTWIKYFTGRDLEGNMKKVESIFDWESKVKSSLVCILFVLVVWCFAIWMIPFGLLIPFLLRFAGVRKTEEMREEIRAIDNLEEQLEDLDLENNKSTFERVKEIGLVVQTKIGFLANVIESTGNIFNFSVPFLSKIAFLAIFLLAILLYFIPFRICFILWGLHKLTLRLFFPGCKLFNQALLNFITAVPDDLLLAKCAEIDDTSEEDTVDPNIMKRIKRLSRDNSII